jgi:hypothetical protein
MGTIVVKQNTCGQPPIDLTVHKELGKENLISKEHFDLLTHRHGSKKQWT